MGVVYGEVERAKDQVAWSLLVVVHLLVRHNHPYACHYIGTLPTPPSLDKRVQDGLWPESGKHKEYVPHKGLIDRRRFPEAFNALCQRMFEAGHTDRTRRPSILEILTVLREML